MDDLFLGILLISLLAAITFGIMAVIFFVKGESLRGKKTLKFIGVSFVFLIVAFIGFGLTSGTLEDVEEASDSVEAKKPTQPYNSCKG